MPYRIHVLKRAERDLEELPPDVRQRIADAINGLSRNPRPPGIKALRGKAKGFWRLRVGEYRVIYAVEDERLTVIVARAGLRRDIYRRL